MSTAVNTSIPAARPPPTNPHQLHNESPYTNGHHHHHHDVGGHSNSASNAKKGNKKKPTDPSEASNLIQAKISQLESDAAGDKEQEAEIGWFAPSWYIHLHEGETILVPPPEYLRAHSWALRCSEQYQA